MSGLRIDAVVPGSIADEMGIEPGFTLVAINGQPVRDIVDYNYLAAEYELTLEVEDAAGELWELEIERDEDEQLGLIFPAPQPAQCGNKCVFCFVHQLPRGLRSPLYVKDEDFRLSFLYGNYVTLANVTDADLLRIVEQRLSPLYVSVHATDPQLREELLGTREIRPVMEVMERLATAGITMHTQVVLCPGLNDGEALERTVHDMVSLHPRVASLAIVPVGLTRHRRGLPRLSPVDAEYARKFLSDWLPCSHAIASELGEPFLFLADEFFIKAGMPFPHLDEYGDLPQLENGVGMIPLFLTDAEEALRKARRIASQPEVTIVTGESPYSFLRDYVERLAARTGAILRVVPVPNRLFGKGVTVTGLVAGQDIVSVLKGKELGSAVIVPDVMLKEGEGVFLDDLSVAGLQEVLGVNVLVAEATPAGLYRSVRDAGRTRIRQPTYTGR